MADIDVSDLMLDPDFVDLAGITVIRRPETINSQGRSVVASPVTFVGVIASVIPVPDAPMIRGPDQQNLPNLIEVHTKFLLRGVSSGFQPDIVVWNGDQFVVNKVHNYSKYGAGFVQADCSSMDHTDNPPSG